jgi:hypothetical protein
LISTKIRALPDGSYGKCAWLQVAVYSDQLTAFACDIADQEIASYPTADLGAAAPLELATDPA